MVQAVECGDTVLNGIQGLGLFGGCWQRDAVGGFDTASAVDKFGVDLAGSGDTQGASDALLRVAVVLRHRLVSDEKSFPAAR